MTTLFFTVVTVLALFAWLALPATLRAFGLHPAYHGDFHTLPGGKALIITTSQATLGAGGKATGVFGSEMTAPYYEFLEAGMTVDVEGIDDEGTTTVSSMLPKSKGSSSCTSEAFIAAGSATDSPADATSSTSSTIP